MDAKVDNAAKGKGIMMEEMVAESLAMPREVVSNAKAAARHRRRDREGTPSEGSSLPLVQMLDTPPRRSLGKASASPSKGAVGVSAHPSPSRDNLVEILAPSSIISSKLMTKECITRPFSVGMTFWRSPFSEGLEAYGCQESCSVVWLIFLEITFVQ